MGRSLTKSNRKSVTTSHAGFSFGSKLEAAVYDILKMRQMVHEISEIQVQDSVYLTDARILYKPDFKATLSNGNVEWHEAKGFKTDVWAIKRRLWRCYGPGPLHIWEGHYRNPTLTETIIPGRYK